MKELTASPLPISLEDIRRKKQETINGIRESKARITDYLGTAPSQKQVAPKANWLSDRLGNLLMLGNGIVTGLRVVRKIRRMFNLQSARNRHR